MIFGNARRIKLLILDVDGVLTDGKIIYTDHGSEIKMFNVRDGVGVKLLKEAGIDVAIVSSRRSEAVRYRANDLGIEAVFLGINDKLLLFEDLLRDKGLEDQEVGYIGDDLVDIPVLKRAGLAIAVADAVEEVRRLADYVTRKSGGEGAVREVCELILQAQDKWPEFMRDPDE
jgi:3-deoxy-D-manno-octulosonate 8-phosphate phosphatase (KDO 8-P phosphatase)